MSKTHVHHHNATAEGAALGVLVFIVLFGMILIAPGAVLVFAVDRTIALKLDVAQLWTFAAVASTTMIVGSSIVARSFSTGLTRFGLLALAVGAVLVVARFGFHAEWPEQLVASFTGHG